VAARVAETVRDRGTLGRVHRHRCRRAAGRRCLVGKRLSGPLSFTIVFIGVIAVTGWKYFAG